MNNTSLSIPLDPPAFLPGEIEADHEVLSYDEAVLRPRPFTYLDDSFGVLLTLL